MNAGGATSTDSPFPRLSLLAVAVIALLALPPFFSLLAAALTTPGALSEAWQAVTQEPRLVHLGLRSVQVAVLSALWATCLGLPSAWVLCRWSPFGRTILAGLLILPALIPPYLLAMGWHGLLGPIGSLRGDGPQWLMMLLKGGRLYTPCGVAFVMGCYTSPLVIVTVSATLLATDRGAEEAARIYRGRLGGMWAVTAKPACTALLVAALLVMLVCMGEYSVPSLYQVNVFSIEIHTRISAFCDINGATVLSLPLLFPTCLAMVLLYCTTGALRCNQLTLTPARLPRTRWRTLGALWCLAVINVSLLFPLAALAWHTAALRSLGQAIRTCAPQIGHSVLVAAATATLTSILGFLLAFILHQATPRMRITAQVLSLPALLLPGTLHGLGIIRLWNRPGPCGWLYGTPGILVVAYLGRYLAVALLPGLHAMRRIPRALAEAARTHGLPASRIATGIYLPLLSRAFGLSWLLVFALTIAELNIAILLAPPGFSTLGVRLFTLLHYGMNTMVAAIALILTAVGMGPLISVLLIDSLRRTAKHARHHL